MKILLTIFLLVISLMGKSQVELTGTVHHYNDSVFYITETGGFHNFTRVWRDNRVKVLIQPDRTFKVIIPETGIGAWYVKTNYGIQIFHFVKGENLQLTIDFSQPNPLAAIGKNAADFNFSDFLQDNIKAYYAANKFLEKTKSKEIDSVLLYRKHFASYKIDLLNQYHNKHTMSEAYYKWLHAQYTYEPYERTLVENISNRATLDDATIAKIMEKGINDEYAALNTNEYNDLVGFYISSILQRRSKDLSLAERFNYVADGSVLLGSTRDVYLSRFMAGLIKTPDSIYQPLFQKYVRLVSDPQMKLRVIERRNEYQNASQLPTNIYPTAFNSLADIFKKYKGKVIYIDFWASWCIPCRAEMPNAAALKEKLKGRDIVFLYFGYNDKEPAWQKARTQLEIQGEHYLLNEAMIKDADEVFGINGIPHYAIIDKKGNLVNKHAERPSDVYTTLVNLINK